MHLASLISTFALAQASLAADCWGGKTEIDLNALTWNARYEFCSNILARTNGGRGKNRQEYKYHDRVWNDMVKVVITGDLWAGKAVACWDGTENIYNQCFKGSGQSGKYTWGSEFYQVETSVYYESDPKPPCKKGILCRAE